MQIPRAVGGYPQQPGLAMLPIPKNRGRPHQSQEGLLGDVLRILTAARPGVGQPVYRRAVLLHQPGGFLPIHSPLSFLCSYRIHVFAPQNVTSPVVILKNDKNAFTSNVFRGTVMPKEA